MRSKQVAVMGGVALIFALTQVASAAGGPSGAPAPHMSPSGIANTDSKFGTDRDKGLNRAQDRMSAQGVAHEQATKKTKHQHKEKKSK